ncbi:MAG TPA: hypothetical protein VGQ83_37150, partial [Polyangia bacterium]
PGLLIAALALGCGDRTLPGSGPGTDAGGAQDGAAAADAPPGGLRPDPGVVLCNGTPCDTTREYCCIEDPGARQIWQCMSDASTTHCGALTRQCDEAADCPTGQKCCVPMTARVYPDYSTWCAPSCATSAGFFFQVCKSAGECPAGVPCVLQDCGGIPVQTCGALDPRYCR